MKNLGFCLAGALTLCGAATANAAVLDGWGLDTNGAGIASYTMDIGHLNLSGGTARVDVDLSAAGGANTVDVGDTFSEFGAIFTSSFTKENSPGATDSGFPQSYAAPLDGMRITLTGLEGSIIGVDASGRVTYRFSPGVGVLALEGTTDGGTSYTHLADLLVRNVSGGDLGEFLGGLLANGTTDMLLVFDPTTYTPDLIRDSSGNSLDALVADGTLKVAVHTQNTSPAAARRFYTDAAGHNHVVVGINSDGSVNMVPEPAPLVVIALGLLGLGWFRRKAA